MHNVPVYEYETRGVDCDICGGRFCLRQPAGVPSLTECPACKRPVRRVPSTFHTPKGASLAAAKKAGFTVLKRLGKGEYEKQ